MTHIRWHTNTNNDTYKKPTIALKNSHKNTRKIIPKRNLEIKIHRRKHTDRTIESLKNTQTKKPTKNDDIQKLWNAHVRKRTHTYTKRQHNVTYKDKQKKDTNTMTHIYTQRHLQCPTHTKETKRHTQTQRLTLTHTVTKLLWMPFIAIVEYKDK